MTKKEFEDCKKIILDKLNYLKSEATKAKINAPKLMSLEKQVNDAIDEFKKNSNAKLDSQKL